MPKIKKRKKSASASRTKKFATPRRARGRRRARKGGLSEIFTPQVAAQTAKTVGMGALGGTAGLVIDRLTPNATPMQKAIYMAVAGFVAGSVLRQPSVAAGLGAIAAYKMLETTSFLADNDAAEWADPIESLPPFIVDDEEGLSEGNEFALADDAMNLADAMQGYNYMPEYAPAY